MSEFLMDQTLADRLVDAISQVIPYHINLMDPSGVIIASTDRGRIGSVHMGGKRLMESGAPQLIVEYDGQYAGCRQGLNLPISVNGSVVGVVGLTGKIQEVLSYGRILRLLLEVMLENTYWNTQNQLEEKARQLFLENWISPNYGDSPQVFQNRIRQLGFRPGNQYTPLLVAVQTPRELSDPVKAFERIAEQLQQQTARQDNLITWTERRILWVTTMGNKAWQQAQLEQLMQWAQRELGQHLICGVGCARQDYLQLSQSFQEAKQALGVAKQLGGIVRYEDHVLEIAVGEIPQPVRQAVFAQIFGTCSAKEIADIRSFLEIYCRNNGSINQIAQELFVHKNTVQYRINKIHEKLGLDLRNLNDLLRLRFALLIAGTTAFAGNKQEILKGEKRP